MSVSVPIDVGQNVPVAGSTAGTVTFATTTAVPSNGKILLSIGWFSTTATLSSVSASGCSGAVSIQIENATSNYHFAIAYLDAPSGLASGSTITATFSDSTADARYICGSYVTNAVVGDSTFTSSEALGDAGGGWSAGGNTIVSTGDILYGGSITSGAVTTSNPVAPNVELHDFSIAADSAMRDVYQLGTGASVAARGTLSPPGHEYSAAQAVFSQPPDAIPARRTHVFAPAGPF